MKIEGIDLKYRAQLKKEGKDPSAANKVPMKDIRVTYSVSTSKTGKEVTRYYLKGVSSISGGKMTRSIGAKDLAKYEAEFGEAVREDAKPKAPKRVKKSCAEIGKEAEEKCEEKRAAKKAKKAKKVEKEETPKKPAKKVEKEETPKKPAKKAAKKAAKKPAKRSAKKKSAKK